MVTICRPNKTDIVGNIKIFHITCMYLKLLLLDFTTPSIGNNREKYKITNIRSLTNEYKFQLTWSLSTSTIRKLSN